MDKKVNVVKEEQQVHAVQMEKNANVTALKRQEVIQEKQGNEIFGLDKKVHSLESDMITEINEIKHELKKSFEAKLSSINQTFEKELSLLRNRNNATYVPAKESKKKVLSSVKKGWDFDTSNSTFGLVIQSGTLKTKFKNTDGSALYFTGNGVREVRTNSGFDTRNGGSITFKMIYGNGLNGGEKLDHGEYVELKCSTNAGASWELMKKYTDRKKFEKWQTVSEVLPFGKVCNGDNVVFKLTQRRHSCSSCDQWAIDLLLIKTTTD